jgi:hypothetical protein
MNPVFQDFSLDIERLKKILALAEATSTLRLHPLDPATVTNSDLRQAIVSIHTASQNAHAEMPIFNGVLLLYLAGRFENYVREIFEDLVNTLANDCEEFVQLPKTMRENLIAYTAEVIASPRKYGHAENGVAAFVRTLADNLSGQPLTAVNSKCLSITSENMRPEVLADLFGRIGINQIWEKIGQQTQVQQFFAVEQPDKATSLARSFLKDFMDLRNQIAHPSGALAWPRIDITLRHIHFCEVIAQVLMELCSLWATTLGKRHDVVAKGGGSTLTLVASDLNPA